MKFFLICILCIAGMFGAFAAFMTAIFDHEPIWFVISALQFITSYRCLKIWEEKTRKKDE